MYEKYLIKMNAPKDWIRHWDEGTQVVNDFILPRGPHEKDEMSDTRLFLGWPLAFCLRRRDCRRRISRVIRMVSEKWKNRTIGW